MSSGEVPNIRRLGFCESYNYSVLLCMYVFVQSTIHMRRLRSLFLFSMKEIE